jgi:hypothetical protein
MADEIKSEPVTPVVPGFGCQVFDKANPTGEKAADQPKEESK